MSPAHQGFGLATLDPPAEVTPHTLFFTGSTGKSFTAAGLSLLVDNSSDYGSVQWDTPISRLLREDFVLSDDWATAVSNPAFEILLRGPLPQAPLGGSQFSGYSCS